MKVQFHYKLMGPLDRISHKDNFFCIEEVQEKLKEYKFDETENNSQKMEINQVIRRSRANTITSERSRSNTRDRSYTVGKSPPPLMRPQTTRSRGTSRVDQHKRPKFLKTQGNKTFSRWSIQPSSTQQVTHIQNMSMVSPQVLTKQKKKKKKK